MSRAECRRRFAYSFLVFAQSNDEFFLVLTKGDVFRKIEIRLLFSVKTEF